MATDFQVPEALRSFGNPLEVHPPRAGAGRTGYFTIGTVCALLCVLTVIGLINPPGNHPPPPIVLVCLTGVFLGVTIVCFGAALYVQSYALILFSDALVRTGGAVTEIFRWDDVVEVYTFINPLAGKHRIVTRDGRKLEIDASVKGGKKLGEAVQQTVLDRVLPEAMKAFDAGETLTFGPLRLNQGFLHFKDKTVEWREVEHVSLLYNAFTRTVQFEARTANSLAMPWCVVPSQNIPNLDVFKKLVERKMSFTQ